MADMEDEIHSKFTYHPPTESQIPVYKELRERFRDLAYFMADVCPESDELKLALDRLREASMWANAAIATRS